MSEWSSFESKNSPDSTPEFKYTKEEAEALALLQGVNPNPKSFMGMAMLTAIRMGVPLDIDTEGV